MAEAAVSFLLENVTVLLKSYVELIGNAQTELTGLKDEMGLLKAFLRDAEKKQGKEEALKELERQIREAVYDAEDTIDEHLIQAANPDAAKSKTNFLRKLGKTSKRVNLAKAVKSIRKDKLTPLLARVDLAKKDLTEGSVTNTDTSEMKLGKIDLIRQDKIVGFEDEEVKIKGFLKDQTDELDVVSIIGMPGLGKTTLAWKIFHDKEIQFHFPTRIWVYVSQDFNLKEVLLKILKGFTDLNMSGNTDLEIAQAVRAYLEQGRFLLVMDDVWDVKHWNAIKPVLPVGRKDSKVLITSRHKEVGDHAKPPRKSYKLRFLTAEESWQLLQYEVFGKLGIYPGQLKDIGMEIAKQCDGLPLAIVVIGGILVDYSEPSAIDEWIKVSKNVSDYVNRYDKDDRISNIIALSYKNLANELKNCFLYLGLFPEDHEIPVWMLTRLWIAEGFIQHEGKNPEDIAEGNLNELINRNLVMIDKTNPEGYVKTCRVHDVIREFCNKRAGIKEQNLFQEIKMLEEGVFDPTVSDIVKYRRLCVHSHIPKFLDQKQLKGPKIRSFLCCNKGPFTLDANLISTIPEAFPLLRVLEAKSFKFTKFPPRVPKLIHLRYLTLSFENLEILPDSISELWNLQTFLIDTKSRTLEIKGNIWKLLQLRHIKTKAAMLLVVKGDGEQACKNLQTLSRVSPEYCTREVFNRACNIKRLGIRGKLATLLEGNYSLAALVRLENLKLVNDLLTEVASDNPLCSIPLSNSFPVSLKRLTLSNTYLDWSHMTTLGRISYLQVLKLKDNAFTGITWNAVGHRFCALRFLLISNSNLVYWKASDMDFDNLRCLVLKNCEQLKEIPKGMTKSLQKLSLDCIGKDAVTCAKKIQETKKQNQGQQKDLWGGFELNLGPGCQ